MSLDTYKKKLDTNMFENWQGINPMGLSDPWSNYKNKQFFTDRIQDII